MKTVLMSAALCLVMGGAFGADKTDRREREDRVGKGEIRYKPEGGIKAVSNPKLDRAIPELRARDTKVVAAGGVEKPGGNSNKVNPVPKTEKPRNDKPKTPAETPKPKSNPATPVKSGDATQGDGYKGPKVVVPVPAYGPGSQSPEKPKNQAGGGMTVNGSAGGGGGKVGPAREKY